MKTLSLQALLSPLCMLLPAITYMYLFTYYLFICYFNTHTWSGNWNLMHKASALTQHVHFVHGCYKQVLINNLKLAIVGL